MRVLVTGALGFAGQAVSRRLLADGHEVVALTSSPGARPGAPVDRGRGAALTSSPGGRPVPVGVEVRVADLRDAAAVEAAVDGIDGVCHLAALTRVRESADDPVRYFDVNVGGTLNLLRALEKRRADVVPHLIFASSGAVYGRREGVLSESDAVDPANPYGASKLAAEQVIGHVAQTGRIAAVTLRCFNIAGAVDGLGDGDLTRIIPKTLAVAAGEGTLTINGDGSAVREYTHVMDVASAFTSALAHAGPGVMPVYNVGSGDGVTLAEVVETAEKVTGRTVARVHQPAKPEARVLMADSAKIRAELGWRPERSALAEILADGWAAVNRR